MPYRTKTHIKRAVEIAGSQKKLATAIGCSPNAIIEARKRGQVSWKMALRIDELSNGEISKHDLRPDVFGPHPQAAE